MEWQHKFALYLKQFGMLFTQSGIGLNKAIRIGWNTTFLTILLLTKKIRQWALTCNFICSLFTWFPQLLQEIQCLIRKRIGVITGIWQLNRLDLAIYHLFLLRFRALLGIVWNRLRKFSEWDLLFEFVWTLWVAPTILCFWNKLLLLQVHSSLQSRCLLFKFASKHILDYFLSLSRQVCCDISSKLRSSLWLRSWIN